tara:strand:+ start:9667 stop:9873 length:207 start_codon:yes stop_codon:yes gene_type:complete
MPKDTKSIYHEITCSCNCWENILVKLKEFDEFDEFWESIDEWTKDGLENEMSVIIADYMKQFKDGSQA